MSEGSETAGSELRRHGWLLLSCMIGFGLGLSGIPFFTLSVFVDPLHEAFGWSVGAVQAGLTVSYLTSMLVLPAAGALADRVGVRKVALFSLTLYGLALMALGAQRGSLWTYYLNWFFIALLGTGTLAITWTRALTRALTVSRGLGLGLALLGSGAVGIFAPTLTRALIDTVGWRWAFVCLGALPILVAVPTTIFFFHDRAIVGTASAQGLPANRRDPRLWLLGSAFVLFAAAVTGIVPNLVKILTSSGLPRADAVTAAGAIGLCVVIGRVSCGALLDRFWGPGVAAVYLLLAAAACLLLSMSTTSPAIAVIAAACVGLAVGAEFDLMPFLVSRYLPADRYTRSLAIASSCFYLGAALSAPMLAYFYDRTGSYRGGLSISIALFLLVIVALMMLGPYPLSQRAPSEPLRSST